MKKVSLLFLLFCTNNVWAKDKVSRTFMRVRPVYQNLAARMHLWKDVIQQKDCEETVVQGMVLYQKSLHNHHTTEYFLIDDKRELLVAGDASPEYSKRDVRAEWIGLGADFSGTLTVCPHEHQIGGLLQVHQPLKNIISFFPHSWINVSVPIIGMTQNLGFRASDVALADAFVQSGWKFGKMDNRNHNRIGVPELKLTFGTTVLDHNDFHFITFSSVNIPVMGQHEHASHIFNPVVDPDGHWGLTIGLGLDLPLHSRSADYTCEFFLDADAEWVWARHQRRTFDLFNKQWSRYMQFRKVSIDGVTGDPGTTAGVNILSLCTNIHRYSNGDISTGFKFKKNGFEVLAGCEVWAAQKERINLIETRCQGTGRPDYESYGIAGTGTSTASRSTIAYQAANDEIFVPITQYDINQHSGEAAGVITCRVNGACGYTGSRFFTGFGAFYELPVHQSDNITLGHWGIWAKLAGMF